MKTFVKKNNLIKPKIQSRSFSTSTPLATKKPPGNKLSRKSSVFPYSRTKSTTSKNLVNLQRRDMSTKVPKEMPQTDEEALEAMSKKNPTFIKIQKESQKQPSEFFTRFNKMNQHLYPIDPRYPLDPLLREHQVRKFGKAIKIKEKMDSESATSENEKQALNSSKQNEKMLRAIYNAVDKDIPQHIQIMKESGASTLEMASSAHKARTSSRTATRKLMKDPEALKSLEHAEQLGFGNPTGETFPQMMDRNIETYGNEEEALNKVIETSSKTNESINKALASDPKQTTETKPQEGEDNEKLYKDLKKYFPKLFKYTEY